MTGQNEQLQFQIAQVDLSNGAVDFYTTPEKDFFLLLGGRGLASKLLFEGQVKGIDPFSPANQLIFSTGKLVGMPVPTAGQMTITAKSPATGLYFKSNVGGGLAKALVRAGWDALVVKGQSEKPVYLTVDNDVIELHDASALWGKTVRETAQAIKEQLRGDGWDLAAIGPAGENLVRFACVMVSLYHAAGRGGLGAVMGAKKLKAVAVQGSGSTMVFDEKALRVEVAKVLGKIQHSAKARQYLDYGTTGTVEYINESYSLPVKNFRKGHLTEGYKISGSYLREQGYLHSGGACSACPMGCHKYSVVPSGQFRGHSGGPEYETLASLGAGCGVTDPEAVLKGNELCNDYGLDTISAGGAIGWLLESVERGVLSPKVADGLDLSWGNGQSMVELLHLIARREGIGDLLAEGVARAARKVGGDSWKWAVEAHGLEQSRVDTRVAKAYALAFAVNPRGPDHLHAQPIAEFGHTPEARELVKKILGSEKYCDPILTEGKAELVRWHEDVFAVTDSLGLCSFATTSSYIVTLSSLLAMLKAALGIDLNEEELLMCGRRTVILERCFNLRENPNRKDVLPWRIMNEPVSEGPHQGQINSELELRGLLESYYELQGFDPNTGQPTKKTLFDLGLLGYVKGIEELY